MNGCIMIKDKAFNYLTNIRYLDASKCNELTSQAFINLKTLHTLIYNHGCKLNNSEFKHLSQLKILNLTYLNMNEMTEILKYLTELNELSINKIIVNNSFKHLTKLHTLYISDSDFKHCKNLKLMNLHTLTLLNCQNVNLSMFYHLLKLKKCKITVY